MQCVRILFGEFLKIVLISGMATGVDSWANQMLFCFLPLPYLPIYGFP
jgi:predicted Rossmann fold nucleotide-binding protein DprA/Smf involved in DNA uptake